MTLSDAAAQEALFARLREEYMGEPLLEDTVSDAPMEQFQHWLDQVVALAVPMSNGMTLATVDSDGRPAARIVLLKSFDSRGLVFYTNYESRKARAMEASGQAALLFWWHPLRRQVRIEGAVERIAAADSDAYFATRPRASNMSAMASPQSQVVAGREWLREQVVAVEQTWSDKQLARPDGWGGYRVVPRYFEFWQGRADRLHDRLCYTAQLDGSWRIERLAP